MGLLSAVLGGIGTFFGGPIGGIAGSAIGGFVDSGDEGHMDAPAPTPAQDPDFNFGNAAGAIGSIGSALVARSGQQAANVQNVGLSREAMAFNAEQAEMSRTFSAGQAQRQMDFQERMSGSQWQRGVADMSAAGLNPMLAYSQGGASAPSGAMGSSSAASGAAARVENEWLPALNAASVAAGVERTQAETRKLDAETATERGRPELVRRQAELTNQEVHESISRMHLTGEQREKVQQEVRNLQTSQEIGAAELFLKKLEMIVREEQAPAEIGEAIAEAKAWAIGGTARAFARDIPAVSSSGSLLRALRNRR